MNDESAKKVELAERGCYEYEQAVNTSGSGSRQTNINYGEGVRKISGVARSVCQPTRSAMMGDSHLWVIWVCQLIAM